MVDRGATDPLTDGSREVTLIVMLILQFAVACRSVGTDAAGDSADGVYVRSGVGPLFTDAGVVASVWPMILFPPNMVKWLASRVAGEDRLCPALMDEGEGRWSLAGGCTDAGGTEFR